MIKTLNGKYLYLINEMRWNHEGNKAMSIGGLIKKFNGSMVGYLPIKIMEGIIGIVTIKVYTTLFDPKEFGDYQVINTTISIGFLICLGWIVQGIIRYSNTYAKDKEKNKQFYSTLVVAWVTTVIALSSLFLAGVYFLPKVFWNLDYLYALLIIFVLISYSLNIILLTQLLYSDKRMLNSVLLLASVSIKLIFTYILTRFIGNTIIAIFISHSVTDFAIGLIAIFSSSMLKLIRLKSFSKSMLKALITFGYPLMGLSLAMVVLNISDRYIIKYFYGSKDVGLYTSNYAISSAIFTMIMFGLSRGIYPKILNEWNNKNYTGANQKLSLGGKYYIIIALPAAIGLFLLSAPIASIALGPKYFEGSDVIGIVSLAMFFYGLSEYFNRGWELKAYTFPILINCSIAAAVNITLNIIFVPIFGYMVAAYSTLIAYIIYAAISWLRANKRMRFRVGKKSLWNILLSCSIMVIIVLAFDYLFLIDLIGLIIVIPLAAIGYFITLFLTGEIKNEISNLR